MHLLHTLFFLTLTQPLFVMTISVVTFVARNKGEKLKSGKNGWRKVLKTLVDKKFKSFEGNEKLTQN